MDLYGIIDSNGVHIDVSSTEHGAKLYATKNGYKKVSIRYNCGYTIKAIAKNNDLLKLSQHEYEEGDSAHKMLMEEYFGDVTDPQILRDLNESDAYIYEQAIENFIKINGGF